LLSGGPLAERVLAWSGWLADDWTVLLEAHPLTGCMGLAGRADVR
jgi:hypothetical protein